ncbi:hypothetical protein BKA64DRAFT_653767 [Cadophora sp. MPI-SDFR-AT-0126]|nr:hypothetical protein BKA64DRAFT_653767 [Leotiomycetes sp. MPI-SDFR-AT-0126]
MVLSGRLWLVWFSLRCCLYLILLGVGQSLGGVTVSRTAGSRTSFWKPVVLALVLVTRKNTITTVLQRKGRRHPLTDWCWYCLGWQDRL